MSAKDKKLKTSPTNKKRAERHLDDDAKEMRQGMGGEEKKEKKRKRNNDCGNSSLPPRNLGEQGKSSIA